MVKLRTCLQSLIVERRWNSCLSVSQDVANYRDAPTEGIRRILETATGETIPRGTVLKTDKIGASQHKRLDFRGIFVNMICRLHPIVDHGSHQCSPGTKRPQARPSYHKRLQRFAPHWKPVASEDFRSQYTTSPSVVFCCRRSRRTRDPCRIHFGSESRRECRSVRRTRKGDKRL